MSQKKAKSWTGWNDDIGKIWLDGNCDNLFAGNRSGGGIDQTFVRSFFHSWTFFSHSRQCDSCIAFPWFVLFCVYVFFLFPSWWIFLTNLQSEYGWAEPGQGVKGVQQKLPVKNTSRRGRDSCENKKISTQIHDTNIKHKIQNTNTEYKMQSMK